MLSPITRPRIGPSRLAWLTIALTLLAVLAHSVLHFADYYPPLAFVAIPTDRVMHQLLPDPSRLLIAALLVIAGVWITNRSRHNVIPGWRHFPYLFWTIAGW